VAKLRITYNAPVVLTFTLAAVVVFVLTRLIPPLQHWFIASPHLGSVQSYVALFSFILGHENWNHLLGNFMLILLLGPILEEKYGSARLLMMILVTALITGIANAALSNAGLLGASGIVFMMILLASMANVRGGEIPLTFIAVAIIYLGGEVVRSFHDDNISQMAHLVGGAVGAGFGFFLAGKKRVPQKEAAPVKAASLDLKGLKAK
jgi:membrane associated rhomboid family serine protease